MSQLQLSTGSNEVKCFERESMYHAVNDLRLRLIEAQGSKELSDQMKKLLLTPMKVLDISACRKKVSIVVPFYRQLDTVSETLSSIALQTYRNIEVVLVNDGDTEDVLEVFKYFAADNQDIECRYYYKTNTGLAETRNFGIRHASGDYVLPLDSDDMIASVFLEKTVPILEQHTKLGFVYTEVLFWGIKNQIWGRQDFDPLLLLQRNQMTCTTLFCKEMWDVVGGYNTNMKHGYEDWDFWIDAIEKGYRGTNIHLPLFIYRRKADSMLELRHQYDQMAKQQIIENHPTLYEPITDTGKVLLGMKIGSIPIELIKKQQWSQKTARCASTMGQANSKAQQ
ncbi:MAG: glycosyltransferase family A protein [Desulforhabdus sp.]|nr:glycosyltransferase family A protein [Desulforhabdus sp.]